MQPSINIYGTSYTGIELLGGGVLLFNYELGKVILTHPFYGED